MTTSLPDKSLVACLILPVQIIVARAHNHEHQMGESESNSTFLILLDHQ
jgi:hypothetical protein